ncbi:MAG: hypothetical protein PHC64_10085 [Candidatus Gastranaerophilales bacterium]|nr:hypothetical protein [Candidatus Gastranaerophilales bacterium]
MDEEKYEKLMDIVSNVSWMVAVLDGYCQNFQEEVKEIYNLKELEAVWLKTFLEQKPYHS